MTCFVVERHEHGVVVRGLAAMSVRESTALVSAWAAEGWDELRPDLAHALGADLAATNAVHREAWFADLEAGSKAVPIEARRRRTTPAKPRRLIA